MPGSIPPRSRSMRSSLLVPALTAENLKLQLTISDAQCLRPPISLRVFRAALTVRNGWLRLLCGSCLLLGKRGESKVGLDDPEVREECLGLLVLDTRVD